MGASRVCGAGFAKKTPDRVSPRGLSSGSKNLAIEPHFPPAPL
jgi:hypothetical protein